MLSILKLLKKLDINIKNTVDNIEFHNTLSLLDRIPNINNGGCGVAALSIYRWLEQHNMLVGDEKFIYGYDDDDDEIYKENSDIYKNFKDNGIIGQLNTPTHVMLLHNGTIWDSSGNVNKEIKTDFTHIHMIDNINLLINNILLPTWCKDFNRKKYIPIIEKKLNIDLNDIK